MSIPLKSVEITAESIPTEIVQKEYRTADIFRTYGIEYCCGMRLPLHMICHAKEIDINCLISDLNKCCRTINLSTSLSFETWSTDFLIDYILHIHHAYARLAFPKLDVLLEEFNTAHQSQYSYLKAVHEQFRDFMKEMLLHLQHEETTVFPYLRQVTHAYGENDSADYARLLIKTLRKPLATTIEQEHQLLNETLQQFRVSTNYYIPPAKSCPNHAVLLSKMKELDNDLTQHFYLENEILIPRIIEIETILLKN